MGRLLAFVLTMIALPALAGPVTTMYADSACSYAMVNGTLYAMDKVQDGEQITLATISYVTKFDFVVNSTQGTSCGGYPRPALVHASSH